MRWRGGKGAVLLLALALTGCVARGSPPLVRIGLVAPFEGEYRPLGYDALNGARIAVRERNASGGVSGYRAELVALNDHGEPGAARQQAAELGLDPLVFGVLGHFRDETTLAAAPEYGASGLALLALGAPSMQRSAAEEGVTRLGPVADEILQAMLRYADGMPIRRAAIVAGGRQLVERDRSGSDLEVLWFDGPGALLEAITRDGGLSETILYLGPDREGAELLAALAKEDWKGTLLGGPALESPVFAGWSVSVSFEVLYFSGSYPVADPGFINAYQELTGIEPGPWAGAAYDGARLLLDGIESAIRADGVPSRSGVVEAVQRAELEGISGWIALDGQGGRVSAPITIYRFYGSYPGEPVASSLPLAYQTP